MPLKTLVDSIDTQDTEGVKKCMYALAKNASVLAKRNAQKAYDEQRVVGIVIAFLRAGGPDSWLEEKLASYDATIMNVLSTLARTTGEKDLLSGSGTLSMKMSQAMEKINIRAGGGNTATQVRLALCIEEHGRMLLWTQESHVRVMALEKRMLEQERSSGKKPRKSVETTIPLTPRSLCYSEDTSVCDTSSIMILGEEHDDSYTRQLVSALVPPAPYAYL